MLGLFSLLVVAQLAEFDAGAPEPVPEADAGFEVFDAGVEPPVEFDAGVSDDVHLHPLRPTHQTVVQSRRQPPP
ncbi:MAG: hypothetical protein ACO1OB_02505, partial [Archangium sp.]